jgi:hypothetical protein
VVRPRNFDTAIETTEGTHAGPQHPRRRTKAGSRSGPAGAAALLVALNQIGDHLGKQLALGALGLGVHRADCGAWVLAHTPVTSRRNLLDPSCKFSRRRHLQVSNRFQS